MLPDRKTCFISVLKPYSTLLVNKFTTRYVSIENNFIVMRKLPESVLFKKYSLKGISLRIGNSDRNNEFGQFCINYELHLFLAGKFIIKIHRKFC